MDRLRLSELRKPARQVLMVFVFVEDGRLEVVDTTDLAQQYEPLDVESGVFVFYDEDGTWLEPKFTKPNRHRLGGLVVEQGAFELVRNSELAATVDPFEVAIGETGVLEPNKYFKSLDEISAYVASKRRSSQQLVD